MKRKTSNDQFTERHDPPDGAECDEILTAMKVADHTVRHCRAVSRVGEKLTVALNRAGLSLNVDLVRAAGLLHDLAKGQPNHALAGANAVAKLGYPEVAKVIASHTTMSFDGGPLDESAVLFLADKLVKGETIVSLQERFQPSLDKFGKDAEAAQAIMQRRQTAEKIAEAVERLIGRQIHEELAD